MLFNIVKKGIQPVTIKPLQFTGYWMIFLST